MDDNKPSVPEDPPAFERHLATIMMADVVGYSRMMGKNEERTVHMLRGHREVFDALLKAHRGRIFNTAGDAILAEFPSAVEAVRCATEIQSALRTRNEHFPEEQRMWFRIGINLGDVIAQGSDLLGDGVNVAARIQTVAEPGGICISGSVYDQIQNKLTLRFKTMGEHNFKNIAQPIRTFSISESGNGPMPASGPASKAAGKQGWKMPMILALGGVTLLAAGGGYWLFYGGDGDGGRVPDPSRQASELAQKAVGEQARLVGEDAARAGREREAAEAASRQVEEMRLAVEAAQRQARLEAEAEFAKTALARAEQEKQRLHQELRKAEEEKRAAEGQRLALEAQALKAARERAAAEEVQRQAQEAARLAEEAGRREEAAAAARQQTAVAVAAAFDGFYEGKFCNEQTTGRDQACWTVLLKVKNRDIVGDWMTRAGKPGTAKGTIAPDGTVSMILEGWRPDGQAINATLAGQAEGKTIRASGKWAGKLPVSGEWKKAD